MLYRVAQILEDLFGIPAIMVEETDNLRTDWGIDSNEREAFDAEFCEEFDVCHVSEGVETVAEYLNLANA